MYDYGSKGHSARYFRIILIIICRYAPIFTEVKVYSDEGEILAKGSATMYIVGVYEKIPPQW